VISGEYNEVYSENNLSPDVWKDHGSYLKSIDPYNNMISLHPSGRGSSAEFAYESWFDFIMQQWPIEYHQKILNDRVHNKPVVNSEYAYADYHDNEDVRTGAWDIFTAGGFYTAGFYHTFAPDKGGWDLNANQAEQDALITINNFIDSIEWWNMYPDDSKVSSGYWFGNESEFVVFDESGNSNVQGEYLDTKTGDKLQDKPVDSEVVIYRTQVEIDTTPPDAPTNFQITE